MLVITRPGLGGMHPAALLCVIGVVCYAFYSLSTRHLAAFDPPETTMVYSGVAGTLARAAADPALLDLAATGRCPGH